VSVFFNSSLGEAWAKQWDLDSQFTGYVRAALEYGFPVAGVVIRGVGLSGAVSQSLGTDCQDAAGRMLTRRGVLNPWRWNHVADRRGVPI
jgi:hypothetical protein